MSNPRANINEPQADVSGPTPTTTAAAPRARWLARWTTLGAVADALTDEPERGWRAWLRTTAGLVGLLVALQLSTGALLAGYYVPSSDAAHTTVAFIEKMTAGGAWLRALHVYGSVLLPAALLLHLLQQLLRGAHRRRPVAWLTTVALLALALAAGGTGYTLPGDARAYYSTRVAEGLVGHLPLVGATARRWLLAGPLISTLTLSRLYALHVLLLPALLLLTIAARLFVFRDAEATTAAHTTPHEDQANDQASVQVNDQTSVPLNARAADHASEHTAAGVAWRRAQLARNALVAGLVFAALACYAAYRPAPFGPRAEVAPPEYLPRPGAQFLWLFELLKHTAGATAALVGLVLPALLLALLALLPWLDARRAADATRVRRNASRRLGVLVLGSTCALVLVLTALAYFADARDPRVRAQLASQAAAEEAFRRAPFVPLRPRNAPADAATDTPAQNNAPTKTDNTPPPAAYTQQCAKCHGAHGEGVRPNPKLIGVTEQPNRTVADLRAILDDPAAYGLEKRMPSFKTKLTADDKQRIADWLATLK
ncbi:MAG TPA: cytochrome b N-terminal domain-containing protein [Pyrinomonadaceae bacterium]|jgi:ubiquinol-cytochrome c reductase cytochrome b subunit